MASFINSFTEGNRTNMDSRTNVDLQGEPFKTFKFKTESIEPVHQATIIYQKNIGGDILIYGNPVFGIWGDFKWGNSASQTFILGLSRLGINALGDRSSSFEIVRVVPPNDIFVEQFQSELFINTSDTTATITTGNANFNLTSEVLISKSIYLNETDVTKATMNIVSTSDVSNFSLYLSNDGTSSFESITNGVTHTFSNSTGRDVRYKLVPVNPGKNITKVTVKINK